MFDDITIEISAFSIAGIGKSGLYAVAQQEIDKITGGGIEIELMALEPVGINGEEVVYAVVPEVLVPESYEDWVKIFKPTGTPRESEPGSGLANLMLPVGSDLGFVKKALEKNPQSVWTLLKSGSSGRFVIQNSSSLYTREGYELVGYFITEHTAPENCLVRFVFDPPEVPENDEDEELVEVALPAFD